MPAHAVSIDVQGRLIMPPPVDPERQSVYIFGMYRSGSSVLEALAQTLGAASGLTPFSVGGALGEIGVSVIDPRDFSRSQVFLEQSFDALNRICGRGGYIYCGFREIPAAYGAEFAYLGAAVLLVRDPRDILISQYRAVHRHKASGASAADIMALREVVSQEELAAFVTADSSIEFVKRIANCYSVPISKGMKVLHFESYADPVAGFDLSGLSNDVIAAIGPYLQVLWSQERLRDHLQQLVGGSDDLRGHSTGGKTRMYLELPEETQRELQHKLAPELELLGYV